jgi:hypothetical protein
MVTFVDETTSGPAGESWGLEIAEERLSARELIRRRVFQEVAERSPRGPDPERQCELAFDAFGRNGFLLLVADRQVEDLDDEVDLPAGTEVVFLKLVPLVGG